MTPPASVDLAVFGLINAGKSSLINALSGTTTRQAGPIGGTTREVAAVAWAITDADLDGLAVRLIDTPGIEEVDEVRNAALALGAAEVADLVLFVVAEDLTETALRALLRLRESGKPIVLALNKVDLLSEEELGSILAAIRDRLDGIIGPDDVVAVAAAPLVRERIVAGGVGRVETRRGEPEVRTLVDRLRAVLAESSADLAELNRVREEVASHVVSRERSREERRARAERVADETSLGLALALAVNPIPWVAFLTGGGGLGLLATRVAAAYDERPSAEAARALAGELLKGGRAALRGSVAAVVAGGAMKFLPGIGQVAGAITQGTAAGYAAHVLGRALVDYFENGHEWGDGGLAAAIDRVADRTDRRALTRGIADRIKRRLSAGRGKSSPE